MRAHREGRALKLDSRGTRLHPAGAVGARVSRGGAQRLSADMLVNVQPLSILRVQIMAYETPVAIERASAIDALGPGRHFISSVVMRISSAARNSPSRGPLSRMDAMAGAFTDN